jgi:hypothetical protein
MSITSETEICRLAVSLLGNFEDVTDIETAETKLEKRCLLWYDISRQNALKSAMPNFALRRRRVTKMNTTPAFGYAYEYEYPEDCLKLLGIDEISLRQDNYNVESNGARTVIQTDEDVNGLPIRFIGDETNVLLFSPDFKLLLAYTIAYNTSMAITADINKMQLIEQGLGKQMIRIAAMMSQENRPVKISNSKARAARTYDVSRNNTRR